jgi:carboxymethylenebutenolidase
VLGLYAGNDDGIPLESVEAMRQALKAAGSASTIVVFPDVPHGFHADYRATYRAREAADGWRRMTAWFRQHGVL